MSVQQRRQLAAKSTQGAGRRLRPRQAAGGQRRDDLRLARLGGHDDRGRLVAEEEAAPHNGSGIVRATTVMRPLSGRLLVGVTFDPSRG